MSETQGNSQELSYKERPVIENPEQVLTQSTDKLVKFGGFDLIETTVEGSQNLNPEKKARKKIFLSEADKKKEREQSFHTYYLKKRSLLSLYLSTILLGVPQSILCRDNSLHFLDH